MGSGCVVTKRAFERRDGLLVDHYESPSGRKNTALIPAQRVGEPLSEEQLRGARESSTQGQDRRSGAYLLRQEPQSEETLSALLVGLAAGNIEAPMGLLKYLDDPRVRPALIDAVRRAPADSLANVAQVVGLAGGAGAKEALRARMDELLSAAATFEDSSFYNFTAGSAAVVAESLLRLDADDTAAAKALRRLFITHPCEMNRRNVAMHAASAYRRGQVTEAMQELEAMLRPLTEADAELFFAALPALKKLEPRATTERCLKLLDDEDELMARAANALLLLPLTQGAVVPRLLEWISRQSTVRSALFVAFALGALAPEALRVSLVRRALADESPSLRWAAIERLRALERQQMIDLARAALTDEPDPALAKALEAAAN